ADRIVFLKDGKIAGELLQPTPELVLDYMKKLGH
ncbi:MAG: ABC transporter ATP-binding protein, partial [Actinobacteria bacterium]|nr:ABC transporter ATP-binding protein [Actinomycetota bacterium]